MVRLSLIVLGLLAAACCFSGAAEGKKIVACRGDVARLPCYGTKKVKVTGVNFEVGEKTCLKGKPYINPRNIHCYNPFMAFRVNKRCNGQYYCAFAVDEKMFKGWRPCGPEKRTNWTVTINYKCV